MTTFIYRTGKVEGDKEGNEFLVTKQNLDSELNFEEVYCISDKIHEWVASKSVADFLNGKYEKIKSLNFRTYLSTMALHTPKESMPKTYFLEKEH